MRTFKMYTDVHAGYLAAEPGALDRLGFPGGAKYFREIDKSVFLATAEKAELVNEDGESRIKLTMKLFSENDVISTLIVGYRNWDGSHSGEECYFNNPE